MKKTALFEIGLLVVATISFAYFIGQTNLLEQAPSPESNLVRLLRTLFIGIFGKNLVSAAETGLWTCSEDKQGSICQEYPATACNGACNTTCFPGRRENFADCKLGTCIDPIEGTCAPQSPKKSCEQISGVWKVDEVSELAECRPGCCLLGDQTQYVTEKTCNTLRARSGLATEFRPVENELACIALSTRQVEGACVTGSDTNGDKACKFSTKVACLEKQGSFYENTLCSSSSLNTSCEKQKRIGCFPGKDEVYWFDSCGNRENIYDANKVKSWNGGALLAKDQSCDLAIGNNLLGRQASCGNCNYLLGSVCGTPRSQDAKPSDGNAVCKDLSCVDDKGQKRKHGESWCVFESQIGVEGTGNAKRSVDVPGSTHYRKVCYEGEIRIEPCQGFRNEICVESRDEPAKFSQAACRINNWQRCLEANTDAEKLKGCEKITDCTIKNINMGKYFTFDRCVPKYPPGFDLQAGDGLGGEVGEEICSIATQTCTAIYSKGITGKWKCKANCDWVKPKFTEAMNNLCMSLGDCGASANILGDVTTDGYGIKKGKKLSVSYLAALSGLAIPKEGQKAEQLTQEEFAALLNLDPGKTPAQKQQAIADYLGYVGLGGAGLTVAGGAAAVYSGIGGVKAVGLTSFGNVALGAAAGAAMGFLIGKAAGLEGDGLLVVTVVGAIAGAIAGGFLLTGGATYSTFAAFLAAAAPFLLIVVAAIIIAVIIVKLLGIGKTKKVKVEFTCKPWQPPKGGAKCDQCGKNGLPCNKYSCQSIGQACEFVNEGTNEEACINVASGDVGPPIISPNPGVLLPGYSYANTGQNGFMLKSPSGDGCLPAFEQIPFGISLHERGQCKLSIQRTSSYADMNCDFGSSSLYKMNHTEIVRTVSLDAVNTSQVEGAGGFEDLEDTPAADQCLTGLLDTLNPNKRNDVSLYVRCQDRAGNANTNEYAIQFCLSPQPDKTPPAIQKFVPANPTFAAIGTLSKNVTFYVNEPAECKWSFADKAYDVMENSAVCETDLVNDDIFGWRCDANLPIVNDNNNYYFRCKDQPQLIGTINESINRNANSQSVTYVIKKTTTPLVITSLKPNNENISVGNLPARIDLIVTTSGGAPGTSRWCEFNPGAGFVRFFESSTDTHKQPGLTFIEGRDYVLPIRCQDDAGNVATGESKFKLIVDRVGPLISRAYQQNGLTVITNEPARCAYSLSSCAFPFSNGTLLQGNDLVHSTSFNLTATHYIICRDRFDNPGTCIAIRAGAF